MDGWLAPTKMDRRHAVIEEPVDAVDERVTVRVRAVRGSEAKAAAGVAVPGNAKANRAWEVHCHSSLSQGAYRHPTPFAWGAATRGHRRDSASILQNKAPCSTA